LLGRGSPPRGRPEAHSGVLCHHPPGAGAMAAARTRHAAQAL